MKKKTSPQDPDLTKMKYTIEANSPYNDGWTKEVYKKEINKIIKKESKKKKIYEK